MSHSYDSQYSTIDLTLYFYPYIVFIKTENLWQKKVNILNFVQTLFSVNYFKFDQPILKKQ